MKLGACTKFQYSCIVKTIFSLKIDITRIFILNDFSHENKENNILDIK